MKRSPTAVIGLGNYLLTDEGVGLHAVARLRENLPDNIPVDLVEAGTPGFHLIHQFQERRRIIFVDGGNCGVSPGEFVAFSPEEVISRKKLPRLSLHEFDLIAFVQKIGVLVQPVPRVTVYCVQVADTRPGETLSPVVRRGLTKLIESLRTDLEESLQIP